MIWYWWHLCDVGDINKWFSSDNKWMLKLPSGSNIHTRDKIVLHIGDIKQKLSPNSKEFMSPKSTSFIVYDTNFMIHTPFIGSKSCFEKCLMIIHKAKHLSRLKDINQNSRSERKKFQKFPKNYGKYQEKNRRNKQEGTRLVRPGSTRGWISKKIKGKVLERAAWLRWFIHSHRPGPLIPLLGLSFDIIKMNLYLFNPTVSTKIHGSVAPTSKSVHDNKDENNGFIRTPSEEV